MKPQHPVFVPVPRSLSPASSMTTSPRFTDQQMREICTMLALGCDRVTACNYLEHSLAELERAVATDAEFAARLRRAEATAEFAHMRTLGEAAKDPKNWRIAVWWLERHDPERFVGRPPFALAGKNLERVLGKIAQMIADEVQQEGDQQRLLTRLESLAHTLGENRTTGQEDS